MAPFQVGTTREKRERECVRVRTWNFFLPPGKQGAETENDASEGGTGVKMW